MFLLQFSSDPLLPFYLCAGWLLLLIVFFLRGNLSPKFGLLLAGLSCLGSLQVQVLDSHEKQQPPLAADIPKSYEELPPESFPSIHPTISLELTGTSDSNLKNALSKHLGFNIRQKGKGDFMIEMRYTGSAKASDNPDLGKREYNYTQGSLIFLLDEEACIGQGRYVLPATDFQGYSLRKLDKATEERISNFVLANIRDLSGELKACIWHLLE